MVKYLLFVFILQLQPFGDLFIAINGKFQLYIVLRLAAKVQKASFLAKNQQRKIPPFRRRFFKQNIDAKSKVCIYSIS